MAMTVRGEVGGAVKGRRRGLMQVVFGVQGKK